MPYDPIVIVSHARAPKTAGWSVDDKLNVNGGATAFGNPIGASGARIVATMLAALETQGLRRDIASPYIGGREATAIAIELLN